jgi:hypothetical protein
MNTSGNPDERFHENLQVLGGRIPVPESPSDEVRSRCVAEFRAPARSSGRSGLRMFRRPAVLSALGLAACLVLFVGFLFPTGGGPTVEAAVILAKLNEQIANPELIELKIDSITINEVPIDGQIQVAKEGIAGDVRVVVKEADEQPIKVDASFGISQDGGWVFVRELSTSDPEVQPVIDLLLPPGTETLLLLPADVDLPGLELDIAAKAVSELGTAHKRIETLTEIVRNQPDTDATVTEQRDGTMLLTVPIPDAQALQDLARMAVMAADEELKREGKESDIDLDEIDVVVDVDDLNDLFGSTLHVVYDPGTKLVRRFAITDFGKNKGSLSVELSDGKIDTFLDASRVTGPNTRTIDLSAFKKLVDKVGG